MPIHQQLLSILVAEEIEHIVAQATRGSGFLRAGEHAYRISKAYPDCGMTGGELVNSVAVEIFQPAPLAA